MMNLFWYLVVFQKIKNSTILEKPFVKRKTFQVLLEDNFVFVLKIIVIILDLETLELESIFLFWSVCLPLEVLLFEFLEKSVLCGFQMMNKQNKACASPIHFLFWFRTQIKHLSSLIFHTCLKNQQNIDINVGVKT